MAERVSALQGADAPRRFGADGPPGVTLREVRGLRLWQVAAWHDTLAEVAQQAARAAGVAAAPPPGAAVESERGALLRVEPLKWWLLGADAPEIAGEHGAVLDLSHSRTHIRISGTQAAALLNRHLPLDLRDTSFAEGMVASGALHHVGVALWRSARGYELFIPRGFALSLWEVLLESAAQFGAEVAAADSHKI